MKPLPTESAAENAGRLSSLIFALGITIVAGVAAICLNRLLYSQQEPTYDSLSYLDRLHRTMELARRDGLAAGLESACYQCTTCLPYLFALLFTPLVHPGRWIGVVFQLSWMFLFLAALDRRLARSGISSPFIRSIAMMSFVSLEVIWFTNGGLTDFRMDLSLMFGYGLTAIAFMNCLDSIAESRQTSIRDWIIPGLVIGATCLVRATSPVYLAASIGPILVLAMLVPPAHFPWKKNHPVGNSNAVIPDPRGQLFPGAMIALLTAVVTAGWFYWINFEYLRYYYFEWNTDANARLPWKESIAHLWMVARQFGIPAITLILVIAAYLLRFRKSEPSAGTGGETGKSNLLELLVAIWFAIVPVSMLIGGGAGLNPFVSMPTTIAAFLALILPATRQMACQPVARQRIIFVMLTLALAGTGARAIKKHAYPGQRFMKAHHIALDTIIRDALSEGRTLARFGSISTVGIHTDSLWSVVQFDRSQIRFEGEKAYFGELRLEPERLFMLPADVNWRDVPGETDSQKQDWLANATTTRLDYVVIPDQATAFQIQKTAIYEAINRQLIPLRAKILERCRLQPLIQLESDNSPARYTLYRVVK